MTSSHLVWTPPDSSPWPGMDSAAFTSFWHAVTDEVRKRFDVSKERSTQEGVSAATPYIQARIDEMLSSRLPAPERDFVGRLDRYRGRTYRRGMRLLLTIITFLLVIVIAMNAIPGIREWASRPVDGFALPLAILILCMGLVFYLVVPIESPGAAEAAMLRVAARVLRGLASPVRPLRLAALALFIMGSLIDLIAALI